MAHCIWANQYVAEKIIKTLELFGIKQYIAHLDVGGFIHQLDENN